MFRSKAARWAKDNEQALRAADPPCPDTLVEFSDRAADAWGPLFAIAQVADEQAPGSDWLGRAHRAALTMMGIQTEESAPEQGVADEEIAAEGVADKDDEIALLVDVRTILIAIDMYAPEPEQLRDRQIAVTALEDARRLADAGQESTKPPKVTPGLAACSWRPRSNAHIYFPIANGRSGIGASPLSPIISSRYFGITKLHRGL